MDVDVDVHLHLYVKYALLQYTCVCRIGLCRYVCVYIYISLGIGNLGHDSEKGSLELLIFELLLPCQERETRQILHRRWDSASIRPDNRIVLDLLDQGRWSFQCLLIRCTKLIIEKRVATFRTLVPLFSTFFGPDSKLLFDNSHFWVRNVRHRVCLGAFTWTTHYLSRFASCRKRVTRGYIEAGPLRDKPVSS